MKTKVYVTLLLITLLIACSGEKSTEQEVDSEEAVTDIPLDKVKALTLFYGDITTESMSNWIRLQGQIDLPPQNRVSVNFPLGGYLKSTKLIPGMKVSKGEVIGVMENQSIVQLQQEYLSAKTKLELANQDFSRQKSLSDNKAGILKNLQQSEAELDLQRVSLRALEEKLKLIGIDPAGLSSQTMAGQAVIRSPINGYVSKVNVNIGKYAEPTETLFELIDPSDIHAALTIFEKDLPYIKKGSEVKVHSINNPAQVYPATVIIVNSGVDDDRTAIAHCHFNGKHSELLPGMYIEAEVQVESTNSKVLPDEAIVRFGNSQYVFVKQEEGVLRMTPVKTGLTYGGKTQILQGLEQVPAKSIVMNETYKLLGMLKNSDEE